MSYEIGTITGVVTDVYPKIAAFDVKVSSRGVCAPPKATIHMILMCVEKLQNLPQIGSTVTTKSQWFAVESNVIVAMILTPEGVFEADELTIDTSSSDFTDIIKKLKLTSRDLLQVATHFDNLVHYFKSPHAITSEDLLLSALKALHGYKFQLQFLRNMKFVDNDPETFKQTYKDFAYWTFGSHWNKNSGYLIGFIFLNNTQTGMLFFSDSNRELPVIFLNQERMEIVEFLNQYVIIKEYNVTTEIYNCPTKFTTSEYLLVDSSKVIKLGISISNQPVFVSLAETDESHNRMSCKILSKSLPIAISQTDVTHWLEVVMEDNKYGFLKLPTPFKDVYPFLKSDHTYHVLYKTPPRRVRYAEIASLSKVGNSQESAFLLELASDTVLIPTASSKPPEICDCNEASKKLTTHYGLISFQGTISLKLFNTPIRSRTNPARKGPNFGTPGVKTPKLRFEADGNFFEVYLNNWENLAVPYGLIPGMKIIVRNVVSQKGKYYKSTALTSFEVLDYEPKIRFETANLYDLTWSVPFYLGAGNLIPSSTVIYGRLLSFSIIGLHIFIDHQNRINAQITIFGFDNFGQCKILSKGDSALTLIRLMLRFHKPAFDAWCIGFCDFGEFTYSKNRPVVEIPGLERSAHSILFEYVKNLETKSFPLDLVCRKMDNEANGPVYFLLDGFDVNELRGS